MKFEELQLHTLLLKAIEEEGYTEPSPIQEEAIPPALEGRDVLGCAQTGTGKTAAFSLPILNRLLENQTTSKKRKIKALILTPTRELAVQIAESFQTYGKHTHLRTTAIFGGVSAKPQLCAIRDGLDVLVATPGRLNDLLDQHEVDLRYVETFVLDEADRMLDMGFINDVRRVLKWIPHNRQTLFFSATMPTEIENLVKELLKNPVKVEVTPVSSTVDLIEQCVYLVDKENKKHLLVDILRDQKFKSVLVFTRTKHGADKVVKDLDRVHISAAAIHGNKSQGARQTALNNFKSGELQVLVATDIAARGIDIDSLECVINYDLPNISETYVHRIGRTGRAGLDGRAIAFCDISEKEYLEDIEKLIKKEIPVVEEHKYPMQIFVVPPKEERKRPVTRSVGGSKEAKTEHKPNRAKSAGTGKTGGGKKYSEGRRSETQLSLSGDKKKTAGAKSGGKSGGYAGKSSSYGGKSSSYAGKSSGGTGGRSGGRSSAGRSSVKKG